MNKYGLVLNEIGMEAMFDSLQVMACKSMMPHAERHHVGSATHARETGGDGVHGV